MAVVPSLSPIDEHPEAKRVSASAVMLRDFMPFLFGFEQIVGVRHAGL